MRWSLGAGVAVVLAAGGTPAHADVSVNLEEAASGLTAPMMMVQPAGDDRRFIAEQNGLVRILGAGRRGPGRAVPRPHRPDHPAVAAVRREGPARARVPPGLRQQRQVLRRLQPADPLEGDLAKHFWWSHTNVIEEYTVSADDPDVADRSSVRQISAIDWPQFNHDGHWIAFGPDGFLYFATGDGGYANDWGIGHNVLTGNGQDLLSPHGKMLRIDVNGSSDGQLRHPGRQSVRRPRRTRRCPRSGPTACATRGAARSTWAATTSSSAATSSRTATRRSASSRRAATTAGA